MKQIPQPHQRIASLPTPHAPAGPHNAAPDDLLLHLGEAWYPPAPAVQGALLNLADRIHRYPDAHSSVLRHKLASYCGVAPEYIIVGNGSDGLIDLIVTAFAGPDIPVVAPGPTFFVYGHSALLRYAPLITSGRTNQTEGFSLNVDALLANLPSRNVVVFLASPNNPTGDMLAISDLERIALAIDGPLVVDECYFEFAQSSAIELLASCPNLIILRSLSKSFALAGLRVGYAIAHPEIIAALGKTAQTFPVNVAAHVAATSALDALEYYRPLFDETIALRTQWQEALAARGLRVFSSRANILLVEYSARSTLPLAPALLEHGIHVANFHARPPIQSCVRITVASSTNLQRFLAVLDTILPA